jgi:hypothetical protein
MNTHTTCARVYIHTDTSADALVLSVSLTLSLSHTHSLSIFLFLSHSLSLSFSLSISLSISLSLSIYIYILKRGSRVEPFKPNKTVKRCQGSKVTSIALPSKGVCLALSGGKRLKNTECRDTQNVERETGRSHTSYKAAIGCVNGAILTCNIILSEAAEASSSTPAFPSTVTYPPPPPLPPALTSVGMMHAGDAGVIGGGGELKALGLSGDGELLACAYTHKSIHLYKAGVD